MKSCSKGAFSMLACGLGRSGDTALSGSLDLLGERGSEYMCTNIDLECSSECSRKSHALQQILQVEVYLMFKAHLRPKIKAIQDLFTRAERCRCMSERRVYLHTHESMCVCARAVCVHKNSDAFKVLLARI